MQRPRLSDWGGSCNASRHELARTKLLQRGPAMQELQQSKKSRRGGSGRWAISKQLNRYGGWTFRSPNILKPCKLLLSVWYLAVPHRDACYTERRATACAGKVPPADSRVAGPMASPLHRTSPVVWGRFGSMTVAHLSAASWLYSCPK